MVVARRAGPELDETLASLAAQHYDHLGVLVVDLVEHRHLAPRVYELMPSAVVHRPDDVAIGYARAANLVMGLGIDTTYYLFCHDDVHLGPDAVTELVREATRSRAAVVGPKYVHWDDPSRLLHVGASCDKFAVTGELAGADEFDQGQRDAVADVLVTPGGVQLVHAGLFEAVGGYDEAMALTGEDVDLCWRAQLAGARVVVAPSARVRHAEVAQTTDDRDIDRLRRRHELRTVLASYSPVSLVLVLPQLLVLTLLSALVSTITLRFGRAVSTLGAWTWNLANLPSLRERRSRLREVRALPDRELRHLQQRGSIRAGRFLNRLADTDEGLVAQTRTATAASLRDSPFRFAAVIGVVLVAVYAFGSRKLLGGIPHVGGFAAFPGGVEGILTQWWDGWRPVGMGDAGSTPFGLALVGFANIVLLGATGLLRAIAILGLIPLGVVGAWRLLRPTTANRARIVCTVVYAVNPVAYSAFARADWSALIAYALIPFAFAALARCLAATPFGDRGGPFGPTGNWGFTRIVVVSGLTVGLAAAFAPITVLVVPVIALGLLAGSVCVGHPGRILRLVAGAVTVSAIALALNAPRLVDLASDGGTWATVGSARDPSPSELSLVELFRFDLGPVDVEWFGWAIFVPAVAALLFARGWRLAWAVRGWFVALSAWGLAWADEWGALPVELDQTAVLSSVAVAGLAVASAMAAVALESDVRRSVSWRRVAPAAGICALLLFALPAVSAAVDGRWLLPRRDLAIPLSVLDDAAESGYRVLWIGDPDVLGARGYRLDGTLAYATTDDGPPTLTHRWIDDLPEGMALLGREVRIALAGQQNRLGERLAGFGVRYVIVVEQLGERPFGEVVRPVDDAVLASFGEQLDLRRVEGVNEAVTIFENAVTASTRRAEPRAADSEITADTPVQPVLVNRTGPASFAGIVPSEQDVIAAYNAGPGWDLDVSGETVGRRVHDGWTNAFAVADGGDGALSHESDALSRVGRLAQLAAWVVLVMLALRLRTSGGTDRGAPSRRSTS